jgi:SAM-dependent methyltransferase
MRCPTCQSSELDEFFKISAVPVLCNQLLQTRDDALAAPTGEVRLGCCPDCAMVFNVAFDESRIVYSGSYENSLHFSARFQDYARELAQRLVGRYGLEEDSEILEIGCGKGEFLKLICGLSGSRGIGIDASFEGGLDDDRIRVIREPFSEVHQDLQADLVCCRHVLEHIPGPRRFLKQVRAVAAARAGTGVFFEVPNALWTLRDLGIWDVIYEHCSYFTAPALERLFGEAGFAVAETAETYGGQFLCLHAATGTSAAPSTGTEGRVGEVVDLARQFGRHHRERTSDWNSRLEAWIAEDRRVAIWGAGSKGVTFLNTLEAGSGVSCAVDINPRKHGRFIPGTGQEVVPPESLASIGADVVLVMNPLYVDEIRAALASLGTRAIVEVV